MYTFPIFTCGQCGKSVMSYHEDNCKCFKKESTQEKISWNTVCGRCLEIGIKFKNDKLCVCQKCKVYWEL